MKFTFDVLFQHFDFPLRFNCLIPEDVHSQIFSNIEQIMEVNKTLLEYMEQTTIGEAFKYLAPFLKLYSSYANNHENAITLLQVIILHIFKYFSIGLKPTFISMV